MELTAEHKKKIKKIVAKADKQTMTVKTVRRTLEKSLGLEKDALKPLKEELTAYVTLLIDPPTPAKEKKKPESTEDSRIVQLKKMGQAVRAGPTLFKGLKDLDADAKAARPDGLPRRFTQHAGDLVIGPPQWGHSTLSDGFTLGLGVLWCDHRWVNVTGGQCHKDTVYDGAKPRTRAGKGRGRGRGRR